MGLLVDGQWKTDWYDTKSSDGRFEREPTLFRNRVTQDGASGFAAEPARYHLYVSLACPWAHRALILRTLKGLEEQISLSVVEPFMGDDGWSFGDAPGSIPDEVNGATHLHEIYTKADPRFNGRVTVPVLWDKKEATIVNNESAEIIRILNSDFGDLAKSDFDFYPEELREEIDAINEQVYTGVNNGVYRCGFATTQEAYEEAFHELFRALDALEARLASQRYLVGNRLTEADWRLFPTLVRFDPVYVGHFKCNLRRIADYPNLSNYLRDLYQVPGVAETVNFDHIKQHYYRSHAMINPTGIVPLGPENDLGQAHDRDRFSS